MTTVAYAHDDGSVLCEGCHGDGQLGPGCWLDCPAPECGSLDAAAMDRDPRRQVCSSCGAIWIPGEGWLLPDDLEPRGSPACTNCGAESEMVVALDDGRTVDLCSLCVEPIGRRGGQTR